MKLSFRIFFGCAIKPVMQILLLGAAENKHKTHHPKQGRVGKACHTLIRNFLFSIVDVAKYQFGLFLFSKMQKYLSIGAEEENYL